MKRREFIAGLGSAAAWPVVARAQQGDRVRRIGVLSSIPADEPEATARTAAFLQTLQELGWTDGRNVRVDIRWGIGDPERTRRYIAELLALAPDVILTNGSVGVVPLQQATRTVPIVFVFVTDPVGAGLVESLARPGGNATGFTLFEYSRSGKWLELLKQIAPAVTRAAVLRDPTSTTGLGQFAAIQSAASFLGMELRPIDVRNAGEIERAVTTFAQAPNGGLVLGNTQFAFFHRELIIGLAARHRLPAVYPYRSLVVSGGLVSYGTDAIDQYRKAAGYVDRILRGEKPADLPVQAPTKYEFVINLKTARALGLTIPETLLATANEVIQ
jgi:putative tryptophan/tyrosine transport system substrate-binding protein